MKWTYLLVFSQPFMSEDEVKHFLNAFVAREDISEWMNVFENTYFLVSSQTAGTLGNQLLEYAKRNQKKEKPSGQFFMTEIPGDRQGWVVTAAWNMVNHQSMTEPSDELDDEIPF